MKELINEKREMVDKKETEIMLKKIHNQAIQENYNYKINQRMKKIKEREKAKQQAKQEKRKAIICNILAITLIVALIILDYSYTKKAKDICIKEGYSEKWCTIHS